MSFLEFFGNYVLCSLICSASVVVMSAFFRLFFS